NYVKIEVRLDDPEGELLTSACKDLSYTENKWAPFPEDAWFYLNLQLPDTKSIHDIYFVCYSDKETADAIYYDICQLHSVTFELVNSPLTLKVN
ncbi:MAG: hypothetical protein ACR2MX_12865, partial [Cyclobacteriaceae bacterium]